MFNDHLESFAFCSTPIAFPNIDIMNMKKETKKIRKRLRKLGVDFEHVMDKGERIGKIYGKNIRKEMTKVGKEIEGKFSRFNSKHDFSGKIRHAMSHLKLTSDLEDRSSYIMIKINLHGVDKKNVNVKITNDHVEVNASKREHMAIKTRTGHRKEVRERNYHRLVPLPANLEHEKARAEFGNGVLRIKIPKKKIDKKIRIS